ncbi:MAG: protein-disulfide reductase DsbD family protein [Armatimonadota bacterium]
MKAGRLLLWFLLLFVALPASAAPPDPVKWSARLEPPTVRPGETAQVVLEATVEAPWHIYSVNKVDAELGPVPTTITLDAGQALEAAGDAVQPAPERHMDAGFKIEVEYFEGAVSFGLPVKVTASAPGEQQATVKVRYQVCQTDGVCLRPTTDTVPVSFTVEAGAARPELAAAAVQPPAQPEGYQAPEGAEAPPAAGSTGGGTPGPGGAEDVSGQIAAAQKQGFLAFLWLAFTMGLLALLTPCVFPMIPITVSFFTKQQEVSPGSGLRSAIAYCLGIIGTFTALGLVMSLLFGAGSISRFATHPVTNLLLALLFIVMAVNLFGGFQIQLPTWMLQSAQAGSQRGGLVGPLLMGLTFTLTSFTCTFAFVGTLLATSASNLQWTVPGMLAFSAAFASPFFLLALFPQWLAKMPRAGAWMVTVKAYMGFLELAAALKFLSNADLVWQLGFLTRPVFLAIWFAIFMFAGIYLLGLIKLPHDDDAPVGWFRRTFGAATLVAGSLFLLAMNGVPLGQINGFFPPREYPGQESHVAEGGVRWLENYDAALQQAKAEGKPVFIDFTGVTCTNCRVMEDTVFPLPEVSQEFQKFVTVRLWTDKETDESRRYADLQLEKFGQTTLPLYVVITPEGEKLAESTFNTNVDQFVGFLRRARSLHEQQVARGE